MTDYFQQQKEQIERINAQTAHDFHRIEFREMCAKMIDEALRQHDQQLQVDVQTTLNGKHYSSMSGLVDGIKKDISRMLQKAFK